MALRPSTSRKNFDATDLILLEALQRDGTQTLEDLARLSRLAPSSIHERLRRLKREGIIRNWTVNIDTGKLGFGVTAFVEVRSSQPCSKILPALRGIPDLEECHSVAGEFSLLLKVRTASPAGLMALSERLREIPGIEGTKTTIVLETHIDGPVPLPHGESK